MLARCREEMLIDRLVTTHSHSRGVGSCSALIHPSIQTPSLPLPPSPPLPPLIHSTSLARSCSRSSSLAKCTHDKHAAFCCEVRGPLGAPKARRWFRWSVCRSPHLPRLRVWKKRTAEHGRQKKHTLFTSGFPSRLCGGMLMKRLRSGEDGSSLNQTYIRTSC